MWLCPLTLDKEIQLLHKLKKKDSPKYSNTTFQFKKKLMNQDLLKNFLSILEFKNKTKEINNLLLKLWKEKNKINLIKMIYKLLIHKNSLHTMEKVFIMKKMPLNTMKMKSLKKMPNILHPLNQESLS